MSQFTADFGHIGAFPLQIVRDRPAQIGIGNVMRGVGRLRQVSARQLVLALRAGLDLAQPARDREFDGLIVAGPEMQERYEFAASPVAADGPAGTVSPSASFEPS